MSNIGAETSADGHPDSSGIESVTGEDAPASRWGGLLLGVMMILVPAVGVPSETMLQDTLKSAIVSLMAIGTALVFFWMHRRQRNTLVWHGLMWLPLILAIYAIGSMIWSHAYLGGVEAIRWLVFSLILWLGMNTRLDHFEDRTMWGIHIGITLASVWTALQFWANFDLFPQSYPPTSTFVNRNFFAEFAICALPFSAYLMVRSREYLQALGLTVIIGFNVVALLMTGTRSALIGLLVFACVSPLIYWRCRAQLEPIKWGKAKSLSLLVVFVGTVWGMGSLPSNNTQLVVDNVPMTALSRSSDRTASMLRSDEYKEGTFSIRATMWAATGRMIKAHPFAGVGAGAWEVAIPLYQTAGSQVETDFYAHNELLQLLAEYGIAGWLFLSLLLTYLVYSAAHGWTHQSETGEKLAPLRATALTSILMLLIVCNAGFPWRLASTVALFALSLSVLAACDAREGLHGRLLVTWHTLSGRCSRMAMALAVLGIVMALYITQRAAESERYIVNAIQLAMKISRSGNASHPDWDKTKAEMLEWTRKGIALNGHYRKLTSIVADEMASIEDWENALWIWKSVHQSRPNVVAIIVNIARANMELGHYDEAETYLLEARQLQPSAVSVRSLSAVLLFRTGKVSNAHDQIKALFRDGIVDYELIHTAYHVGERTEDFALMIQALELRKQYWPQESVDSWLKIGHIYAEKLAVHDEIKALSAYKSALAASSKQMRTTTMARIPPFYRSQVQASAQQN